jgi:anti-anti-sigma factor
VVNFETSTSVAAGRVVVRAVGELDLDSGDLLRTATLRALGDAGVDLVVDLSGVTFIDCAGLAALLSARREVREHGGDLRIAGPSALARRLLGLTGLADLERADPMAHPVG